MKLKSMLVIIGLLFYCSQTTEASLVDHSSSGFVRDLIAKQISARYKMTLGTLTGYVTNGAGVAIGCGGSATVSLAGGYYTLSVPEGFYYVTAVKSGLCFAPVGVYICAGETLHLNIAMGNC